jgi:hypothetical protein
MDRAQAIELIQRQRGAASVSGTDADVAQRAARGYLGGGIVVTIPALFEIGHFLDSGKLPIWRVAIAAGLLLWGVYLFWKSWQFTQARRVAETPVEQKAKGTDQLNTANKQG